MKHKTFKYYYQIILQKIYLLRAVIPKFYSLKYNKFGLLIYLLFTGIGLFAQQIQNIRFDQEGKNINIYYDLTGGKAKQKYDIQVYCSTDGGSTWGSPLQTISGAVGENQKAGYNKKIIWDVLAEKEKLTGNIKFKINAVFSEFSY